MNVIKSIISRAKNLQRTIVFPEASFSERTLNSVKKILKNKVAKVILLGKVEDFSRNLSSLHGATIIDVENSDLREEFSQKLFEKRQHKGMTLDMARRYMSDYIYFATMLVDLGYADGMVAGAEHPTRDVLRPALQIIGTKEGIDRASSCFMMVGTDKLGFGEKDVLFLADCAMLPHPSSSELCDITLSTADTARKLADIEPRVAMLSFSSFASAEDESIDIIRDAIKLVKEKAPSLAIDGEMQLDCALVPRVARLKCPKESEVAGRANILIFPDLNSGNIGYKIMQRFSRLKAVGVIIQGLSSPVNDLSRGCSVEDIYLMTAITAIQAGEDNS